MNETIKILDEKEIEQKLIRIAWEVYERNIAEKELIFIGISTRGLILAKRLAMHVESISNLAITVSGLKIDKKAPYNKDIATDITPDVYSNKVVVLVDDVLKSGKTLMYVAKYFLDAPLSKLSTMVLVDRNHNRYPIKADYVGLSLATTLQEYINVTLEGDSQGVYLS